MAKQDTLAKGAGALGFIAAGGMGSAARLPLRVATLGMLGKPAPGMPRGMRTGRRNLGPALISLAAANQQLVGAVYGAGRTRRVLRRVSLLGVAAAGVAVATADESQRKALLAQGQSLLTQGEAILDRSGVLDKVLGV